ncbi:MAG: hypothetical protein ACRDOI_38410 [Trebonia sp.]
MSLAVLAVSATAVAACSSSGGTSSSAGSPSSAGSSAAAGSQAAAGTGGGPSASAIAEAKAELAKYAPTTDPVIVPQKLTSPPKKGVKLTLISCSVPACTSFAQSAAQVAKQIGWTLNVVNEGVTPQTVISAFKTVDQNPGDAVIDIGILPISAYYQYVQKLPANVPFVEVAPGEDVTPYPRIGFAASAPNEIELQGKVMADWVVANSGGQVVHAGDVVDPTLTGVFPTTTAFTARLKELCSACTSDNIQISTAKSNQISPTVVNYFQSHSDANFLVASLGSLLDGVPAALNQAGIHVKITARAEDAANQEDIKAGLMTSVITSEVNENPWEAIGGVAQLLNGQKPDPIDPIGVFHTLTKDNLPADTSQVYTVPNYQQTFLKAWGLAS